MRDRILDQICEHAFQRARISHDYPIAALPDRQVRPVMTQRINAGAQGDRFKKECPSGQIYQKE